MPSPAENTEPDIFERLRRRALDYRQVKNVVQFTLPQTPFLFARQFGSRTIKEVLTRIESWKQLLERDYLLPDDLQASLNRSIRGTEDLVWATIRDVNLQIGDWTLRWYITPPGEVQTEDGERLTSGQRVIATNSVTRETRTHELPGYRPVAPPALNDGYREAFRALGVLDRLWLGSPGPMLISRRPAPQGWPLYTRWVIRPLYELLAPHYKSPGHYSAQEDRDATKLNRHALYSKALLADMLEILRMEHPQVFGETTANQLKSAIGRHLAQKSSVAAKKR